MNKLFRIIAFYLPQFHPIPENDEWWGKGFTEWTNVAKAKPMFRGHYQPHIPADLGFYDLRVPETRIAQAEMAKEYGIEAFCYYHYWFAGKRLLERPLNEVLESGEPTFPFCLCWANQTWSGIWHGEPNRVLIEQTYPGNDDHRAHFETLLPAFKDKRYVTVEGKPLFIVFLPKEIPNVREFTDFWRDLAIKSGLKGLFMIAIAHKNQVLNPHEYGFDAGIRQILPLRRKEMWIPRKNIFKRMIEIYREKKGKPTIYPYKKVVLDFIPEKMMDGNNFPCLIPNWDNTPRCSREGLVLHGSTPELFRIQVKHALRIVQGIPSERRLIFIKSWNEWAEGNYLEADLKFGKGYLEVIKEEISR